MIKKVIISCGTAASIFALAFITGIPGWLKLIIMAFGVICLVKLVYDDYNEQNQNEKICHSDEEIQKTMKTLVKTQGKVCIMSRDLTWVNSEIETCMIDKKSSMLIFCEKETDLTARLTKQGVSVKYYGKLNFEPKTRFTVMRYNRDNPQVAIASSNHSLKKKNKFEHVIYETSGEGSKQDKWITSLALDMIKLCECAVEVVNGDEKD